VRRELVLTAGDASAIALQFNGADAARSGKAGEVVTARFTRSTTKIICRFASGRARHHSWISSSGGEVERDVRTAGGAGDAAPRAHEQLGHLVLLLEIRIARSSRDRREPSPGFRSRCWRSFGPLGTSRSICASFPGDRGIFPGRDPPIDAEVDVDDR